MNCVTALNTCTLAMLLFVQTIAPAPADARTNRGDSTRNPNSFNPCKTATNLHPTSKKRVTKAIRSVLSICGLRMIPLLGNNWGSPEKISSFLPRTKYLGCLTTRVVYAAFTDKNGRLPQQIALNASSLVDLAYKMMKIGFSDESVSSVYCSRKARSNSTTKRYCYAKTKLMHAVDLSFACTKEILNNKAPEYADIYIYGFTQLISAVQSSGFINYLSG